MDAEANPTLDAVAGAGGALLALLTTYPLMTLNTRQHTSQQLKKKKAGDESAADADSDDDGGGGDGDSDADAGSITSDATPTRVTSPGGGDDGGLHRRRHKKVSSQTAEKSRASKNKTIAGDLRDLMREGGGVSALYRGIEPAVIGTVTSQAVYNFFYSTLRTLYIKQRRENPGALPSLGIASVAGSINVLLTIPIWTVVTRMQAARNEQQLRGATGTGSGTATATESGMGTGTGTTGGGDGRKGFIATALAVLDDSGVAGFWRGVVPSLVMVSNPALQYMFYESVADRLKAARAAARQRSRIASGGAGAQLSPVTLTAAEVFFAGALAKLGATVITYPILLVKSRLQAMGKSTDQSMMYAGTLDALR